MSKICTKCNTKKEATEFYKDKRVSNGLYSACKICCGKLYNSSSKGIDVYTLYQKNNLNYWAYQREYRRKYCNEGIGESRKKYLCRQKTNYAIRVGDIIKKPCEICGSKKAEAHHDDYNKFLEVRWLCRKHHMEIHKIITNKQI